MIDSPYLVHPGKKVHLPKIPADDTGPFKHKDDAHKSSDKIIAKLSQLQEVLYAEQKRSLLIILQAMDTGGKDGTIRHVFTGVNPAGCSVVSFKAPSSEELAHDYLWRIHRATPARGMITIFNRSQYESVLIERVHKLVPTDVWKRRYDHINAFEKLLTDEGTTILKFFLHISKNEQLKRLDARLDDPDKNWKSDPNDMVERQSWNQYQSAYEDALTNCSTSHAPWYIVPADHKWFRNHVVGDIIVRTMEHMKLKYPIKPAMRKIPD
ncbi:MAG TPA: polyphosphate kinase 2 family protein [Tepidisphaeraceae bacterium]|jgi:PPK2 family polyphosphate:nucleotide phosphotransferase|nr:polyphosphate kinase 2 family protein [Tepidisphaeraceae bacterium]